MSDSHTQRCTHVGCNTPIKAPTAALLKLRVAAHQANRHGMAPGFSHRM